MVKNNIIMGIFNILGHPVNKTQNSLQVFPLCIICTGTLWKVNVTDAEQEIKLPSKP